MAFKFNPDKYLRAAYGQALQGFGYTIYADSVPKPLNVGDTYILITSITRVRTQSAKPTDGVNDNWSWLANITFDINVLTPSGFANPTAAEDIEENIINTAEQLEISGWTIKSRVQVQSRPLPINSPTTYVNRRVLTYQHWIDQL